MARGAAVLVQDLLGVGHFLGAAVIELVQGALDGDDEVLRLGGAREALRAEGVAEETAVVLGALGVDELGEGIGGAEELLEDLLGVAGEGVAAFQV